MRLAAKGRGLAVRVTRIDDLGRTHVARVSLAGFPLAVSVPEGVRPDGDEAGIEFEAARINIYADGHLVTPRNGSA